METLGEIMYEACFQQSLLKFVKGLHCITPSY